MSDVQATLQFLATVELLGLAAWPLTGRILGSFPDRGWAFSKTIGILLTTWACWIVSALHLVSFQRAHTAIVVTLLGGLCWAWKARAGFLAKMRIEMKRDLIGPGHSAHLIIGEILFVATFLGWTYLRSRAPQINGLEKFMDYGFMLSALKTQYFPPLDHFLGGESINYYYLGHVIAAVLVQLSGVTPGAGFNLQMSSIFGLGVAGSFAIGSALYQLVDGEAGERSRARSLMAGLMSATIVMFLGNLHYLVVGSFHGGRYWFPEATRFIPDTIHEFPFYSFIVNDLHAHVSDIPTALLNIALGLLTYQVLSSATSTTSSSPRLSPRLAPLLSREFALIFVAAAFSVGSCYAVNTWDLGIYLFLFGCIFWSANARAHGLKTGGSLARNLFSAEVLVATALESVGLMLLAVLLFLPHWLAMRPPAKGVAMVPLGSRSPPMHLLVVWGIQVYLVAAYLLWRRSAQRRVSETTPIQPNHFGYPELLLVVAAMLIAVPELIYVKDIFPSHPRANTMFKFAYQAWIALGLVAGMSVPLVWNAARRSWRSWTFWFRPVAALLIAGGVAYSVKAVAQAFSPAPNRRGVDGTEFLDRVLPADAAAIRWMNENLSGQPTIVESVGESYSLHARVATFTGFPTVLGWPDHESLWRDSLEAPMRPTTRLQRRTGQPDTLEQRREDVWLLYLTPSAKRAREILDKYDVAYVYLGDLERLAYPKLKEEKFWEIAKAVVYDRNGVRVFKVRD
jgi:uncharacterized membrane protein